MLKVNILEQRILFISAVTLKICEMYPWLKKTLSVFVALMSNKKLFIFMLQFLSFAPKAVGHTNNIIRPSRHITLVSNWEAPIWEIVRWI